MRRETGAIVYLLGAKAARLYCVRCTVQELAYRPMLGANGVSEGPVGLVLRLEEAYSSVIC